jgi:cyclic beta-1,2-glucan synthetase
MAHPLNRPYFDEKSGRVIKGYGLLQPRVAAKLSSSRRSLLARLTSGEAALDPYTKAVSDVYQDLFQEGSFVGKGIYNVEAFEKSLKNRLPENLILSHDLLEGAYARCGLVSDVVLYEEQVHHFEEDARRRHRWVRGDWQIFRWLFRKVPDFCGKTCHNPLSYLSKWKILDNLRRSLVAPATLALFFVGWFVLKEEGQVTIFIVSMLLLNPLLTSLATVLRVPSGISLRSHLARSFEVVGLQIVGSILSVVFLPYEAQLHLDAVSRAWHRMLISKRKLLEWRSTSHLMGSRDAKLLSFLSSMSFVIVLSLLIIATVSQISPHLLPVSGVFVGLWVLSPTVAFLLSRVSIPKTRPLSQEQETLIRCTARKTWRFFDEFVSLEDNWLPPDNYQENPVDVVAHRTSPTNIGLSLLSQLAAYDFCYISGEDLLKRIQRTFSTLARMERFRGHFYNWYDTQTLRPLHPLYVSTVDSGNLSGMLLTLKEGLRHFEKDDIVSRQTLRGLQDTLQVLGKEWRKEYAHSSQREELPKALTSLMEVLRGLEVVSVNLRTLPGIIEQTQNYINQLQDFFGVAENPRPRELEVWWKNLHAQWEQCLVFPLSQYFLWLPYAKPSRSQWENFVVKLTKLDVSKVQKWEILLSQGERIVSRSDLLHWEKDFSLHFEELSPDVSDGEDWLVELKSQLFQCTSIVRDEISRARDLALQAQEFASFEFEFLYDRNRHLLTIGYNVREHRKDASHYDLPASEARLASYIGIALGHLPQDHWFALGRLLTSWRHDPALLSWSGSMFEYLMPLLVMPHYPNTLLAKTYTAVVGRQMEYGRQRAVPWGVSESGYNATDAQLNYQYRAFGVPGLGFKRGLAEDLVVAPYASLMSVDFAPAQVCENLLKLQQMGAEGRYGFYEALDFTPSRVDAEKDFSLVQSFMSHHQGMAFVALSNHLLGHRMHSRFLAHPEFRAVEMLLQERIPKVEALYPHAPEVSAAAAPQMERESVLRVIKTPHSSRPKVHMLSNGRYSVAVTNSGGGFSRWKDLALTRWREDPTCDNWGTFCYIRDLESGELWSSAYQPTLKEPEFYEAIFPHAKAEFRRRDNDIEIHTEITVSPEDDIELRRFTLTNWSSVPRLVELTTYSEIAMAPQNDDEAHQAFGNLFVQTEVLQDRQAIICTRRPRSGHENPPTLVHLLTSHAPLVSRVSYETERGKFVGRTRGLDAPLAFTTRKNLTGSQEYAALSGSEGSVLDPIIAIRCVLRIPADESISVHCVTGVGETRAAAESLIEKYHDRHVASRVFELAWSHRQIFLRQLNLLESEVQIYERMTSSLLYVDPAHRSPPTTLQRNKQGQSSLWGYGISGDLPIVIVRVSSGEKIELVRQIIQAHGYWRVMGLTVDLVIWNEEDSSYLQLLQEQILSLINANAKAGVLDKTGGIFVRKSSQVPEDDAVLLFTLARLVFSDAEGALQEQMDRRPARALPRTPPALVPSRAPRGIRLALEQDFAHLEKLPFFNGLGGFSQDYSEYVIRLRAEESTPAPWSNVLANPFFGSVISESGSAYTWCENAHEYRLTPWSNDSVRDTSGECFYVRDEETGEFWSPTPQPCRAGTPYTIRHGFGYTSFANSTRNIETELTVFVPLDAPVKISQFRIKNHSHRARRLSLTGYCEWVLGELRAKSLLHLVSEKDPGSGSVFVRNAFHPEFGSRLAFFDCSGQMLSFTCDRSEFLGRNGTLKNPKAMHHQMLSGRLGAGLDACTAVQSVLELAPGEEREVVFVLGVARDVEDARTLLRRFRSTASAVQVLASVRSFWKEILDQVEVQTPDASINALMKGWLIYQTLACRVWARSGFYQSGGAFGFRDQLQDVMALLHTRPDLLKEQIIRCCGRQYKEGDVQHWWHPPTGKGVRTHFSDDYLWLPLAVSRYVTATLDFGLLDVRVPFLEGRHVKPDEEAYYDLPLISEQTGTVYEHCVRALRRGLQYGRNGLPLIGCGDWNDGMNLVGAQGKGESVWLGFFLYDVLGEFEKISVYKEDLDFVQLCQREAKNIKEYIEKNAWDGQWYRRGYFDDGQPLGSSQSEECQIDSLPQSWSVLSGAGDPKRSWIAMNFVEQRLVDTKAGIVKLFDPPFDKSAQNPGYIKGYVPGVRENGGQYTHAAIWTTMAFAALGDAKTAWELMGLINPIRHADTRAGVDVYKVEPYVVAADVYAVSPHTGRGGWTWYTGSAGWMYRLILESLLGVERVGHQLHFNPCVPDDWDGFGIAYRFGKALFRVQIVMEARGFGETHVKLDGEESAHGYLELFDDGLEHKVEVRISRWRKPLSPQSSRKKRNEEMLSPKEKVSAQAPSDSPEPHPGQIAPQWR